jgi:hypothetical protein
MGQECWNETAMPTTGVGCTMVAPADVDGDGDMDAFSSARDGDPFVWHENLTGDGSSWSSHVMEDAPASGAAVVAADIDGDGDQDALCCGQVSLGFNVVGVFWIENVNGDGSAWTLHPINQEWLFDVNASPADVDGDGDLDVLYAGISGFIWHENLDGDGTSWTERTIDSSFWGIGIQPADVDGDGDVDGVALGTGSSGQVLWLENLAGDGSTWALHPIDATSVGGDLISVDGADVDGDGDIDVCVAYRLSNRIAWFENLLGDGTSWNERAISANAPLANWVSAVDMDADLDLDMVVASIGDESIAWHENLLGDGSSWSRHLISANADEARMACGADVDGDGDMDALSASVGNVGTCKIAWYENDPAPAAAVFRNAGSNPASFTCDAPVLGQPWQASVDLTTTGSNFAFILARRGPFNFQLMTGQILLVDLASSNELLNLPAQAGPIAIFNSMIPSDMAFCGFTASLQAVHFGGASTFFLSNAMDLTAGL